MKNTFEKTVHVTISSFRTEILILILREYLMKLKKKEEK